MISIPSPLVDAIVKYVAPSLLNSRRPSGRMPAKDSREKSDKLVKESKDATEDVEPFCSQAFVLPARLTHTRFMPVFHRWIFSHFMCGIPVTGKEVNTDLITIDDLPWSKQGWFRVEAQDHLERTPQDSTLREKLDKCLRSKGVEPKTFPYAYLVTPPRFLWFPLFNAVTLWFLYLEDQRLGALLVEVHNSSQERANYLLHDGLKAAGLNGEDCPATAVRTDLPSHVEFTCDKWFHANAFTNRNGFYSTRVIDPLNKNRPVGAVDATITLKSETGPTRLVARLQSHGKPIVPYEQSRWGKLLLILQCTSTMILMFPQALFQMFMLRFKCKLKMFAPPVPLPGSVSRPSTGEEIFLESIFRHLLVDMVQGFPGPALLRYESAEETTKNPTRRIEISSRPGPSVPVKNDIQLQVLSPAFYSNLVHYSSMTEAIQCEIVRPDYSAGTIYVQNLTLLKQIMSRSVQEPPKVWYTKLLKYAAKLRSSSRHSSNPSTLDCYVLGHSDSAETKRYIRTLVRLLVDRRSGIGLTALKLWGLLAIIVLGGLCYALPASNHTYSVINGLGYYMMVAGGVMWSIFVTKEDLAEFLLI